MKTYHEFLLFATRRLKLNFKVVEFIVKGFLRKYHLSPCTLECYLYWENGRKTHAIISEEMGIPRRTVTWHLNKLEFICPELFVLGAYVPEIPWMYHPTEEEWEELERMGAIKEMF